MRKTRSLKRNLAVILAAVMLVVAVPGYFLSASAAESVPSEESAQEEMLLSSEGSTSPEYAPEEEPEALEEENQPEAEEESVIQEEESQEAAEEEPVALEEDQSVPEEENLAISEEDLIVEEVKTQTNTASHPVIAVTYAPPYGEGTPIQGVVFNEDGSSFNPSDYRISVFVQASEGAQGYPKPTDVKPYIELFDDGTFSAEFNTNPEGYDLVVKVIHIMLIPSSYTPSELTATQSVALDSVKVTRTEGGGITITPEREAPPPPHAEPAINAPFSVSEAKIGLDVGFYTDGSMAGSALRESQIRQHLEAIAKYTDTVRFYSTGGPERAAYSIAREMGFNIVGTAYLTGNTDGDNAEMDALIELCNDGLVDVALVGNETLLDLGDGPKLTAEQLIADIQYVRERVTNSSIPISTADTVDDLLVNASVRNACNIIVVHCYPFHGGTLIDSAAQSFIGQINSLKAVSGDKQVLIGETGWPTGGSSKGDAVPNEENAAQYFDQIWDWSVSSGTYVLYFEAFDEPWKADDDQEGDFAAHWGFMTTQLELKERYKDTTFFKQFVDPIPIDDAEVSGITDQTYTGSEITLNLTVKLDDVTLESGTDYTVSYSNNVEVGEATVTITGIGKYTGTITRNFLINDDDDKISIKDAEISGITDQTYTGNAITLNPTVKLGDVTLESGTDYTVTYSNNVEVGEATVTITGIGEYYDTVTRNFLILPGASKKVTAKNVASGISLRWEKVDGATYYHVYRGEELIAETSKLECVDKAVVNNIGEKYTYKVIASKSKKWFSTKARTATMYRLRPVAITSLTSTEPGKMTVKYDNGGVCTGYVVRYGMKSDMSDAKVISVQGVGTTQRTFNNLTKGKTYYVQVRTYKNDGTRYYSAYSYTKSVKIMEAAAPAAPQIALTYVPAYGKYADLKGKVFMSDASTLDTSKYKILVFIEINENWGYWPKPTFASPYTELKSDGSFTVDFTTGPDDETAKILHVMLVPTSVKISEKGPNPVSGDSFGKIKAKAVDYVRIDRTQSGGITISPRRVAATAIKSVTNSAAGKITVTYGKSANASGYTIRYGLKSDMSDAKSVTVSGAGTVSKTISGLTKGKTYYVQVRAYLTENGSKLYSDYSAKKSVKITK